MEANPVVIRPAATKAKPKQRHFGLLISFLLLVVIPTGAVTWYLFERAQEQYASTVAFTVRSESSTSATDFIGGLGAAFGSTSTSSDTDILYEFIRSQPLVEVVDAKLDLRSIYSRETDMDPIFSFHEEGTIEDLTRYWSRMVRVAYDASSGLMELRVLAFSPDEAQSIAETVMIESGEMINQLAAAARSDATRYAQEDLDIAIERLKETRELLTSFRIANEIVDPEADVQGQMGLLNTLQTQMAEALIEFDLLSGSTRQGDPRLSQAEQRISVIEARIREERQKFGTNASDETGSYAETIAGFERLTVDREIAEQAYAAALTAFDAARAEANRKSRYLASYILPTKAERSEFPQIPLILAMVFFFSLLAWTIGALVYYSLRDRR